MDEIKKGPEGLGNPKKSKPAYDNSCSSQQVRLLKHFEVYPRLSTIEARDKYGILSPPARIKELRQKGYRIDRHWTDEPDSNGVMHRVGMYVYQGRAKQEKNHGK